MIEQVAVCFFFGGVLYAMTGAFVALMVDRLRARTMDKVIGNSVARGVLAWLLWPALVPLLLLTSK